MKKTIICMLIFLLCFSSAAYAYQAPEISVTDVNGDVITVSGVAESNSVPVSLVILNPGYTKDSLAEGGYESTTAAVQTFKAVYPVDGIFTFDVPMKDTTGDAGGGTYTVYITEGETEYQPISYMFYFQGVKLGLIESLNDSLEISDSLVEETYLKYGLGEFPLYKNTSASAIGDALEFVREDMRDKKFPKDTASFDTILKEAALIAAYNSSKANILVGEDGYLKYDDILKASSLTEWKDYKESLSSEGVKSFNKDLIAGTYKSISDITKKLRELTAYYGIIAYKEGGFGHFDYFFDEYDDVYDEYDFKLSKVKSKNKNKIYKDVLSSTNTDIEGLSDDFNEIVESYSDGGSSGGGGGGGGSVGGGTSVAPTVPTDSYIVPEISFGDLGSVEWARSAVMYLAQKGIVSGKAKNVFAPKDLVTRGEFLKMLTMALSIESNNSGVTFEDTKGHWAEKYIAAAVDAKIASGISETEFAPNLTVTREMCATFITRGLSLKGLLETGDDNKFADHSDISGYAVDSVYSLRKTRIMSGVGENLFNPKGNMTRAEAARAIYALMIYSEEVGK